MKKFVFFPIIIVFLTIFTLTVYAQDSNSNTSPQEAQPIQTKSDNEKLSILETKVNIMNDYNSNAILAEASTGKLANTLKATF